MAERQTDGSVFADSRNIGLIRPHVERMLGLRHAMRDRYPEEWEPFDQASGNMDYYCSAGAYILSGLAEVEPAVSQQMIDEVEDGMSVQVAAEKAFGNVLSRCIGDEAMTLGQFFVYAEMSIAYNYMQDNRPTAELMRRYLDEPDECLM